MSMSTVNPPSSAGKKAGRGFGGALLDRVTNVWFGVALLILLFFYCSIGSAVPAVRQLPFLEMTEFDWFHWWPFQVLIFSLCTILTLTTIRRIPLRLVNAGVWMIHSGIIILCLGSYYYFGTKIEGDAPVFRRSVSIHVPNVPTPASLVCVPGASTSVVDGAGEWKFAIQSTNTDWPILSEEHKGEKAYAVNVAVTKPDGEMFIRQLLAGYPQYIEDVIPGKGRAIKNIGRKLVDEDLKIELAYEAQEYFHVMNSWALYVRRAGERQWRQRPIHKMPRYNDFIASREAVFVDFPLSPRVLDIEVKPGDTPDALMNTPVRVTAYLRYATMERRWREGNGPLNPVLRITAPGQQGTPTTSDLVAFDSSRNHAGNGLMKFYWLADETRLDQLPKSTQATLHISVPASDISLAVPLNSETIAGPSGALTALGDSGFSYSIRNVLDNLSIANGTVSVAMVNVKTPDGVEFTRMVADRSEMTKDLHGGNSDPHAPAPKEAKPLDRRITMVYQPPSPPLLFAAVPGGKVFLAFNGRDGRELLREMTIGESVEVAQGFSVRADAIFAHGESEVKPYIVPPERRNRDVGVNMAMIRLEIGSGASVQSLWLSFNAYAFDNDQYAGSRRFSYSPRSVRLPDGSAVEIMFSRERRKLPNPVALEDFELLTHVGGYTGNALTIRNYVSWLRFLDDGEWSDAVPIQVNQPTEYGGYWYFQSSWDPPQRGMPGSGMNYTGLGVGNRNGVFIQLAGCCIAVSGMIFAFYVKPILIRQRRTKARAKISRTDGEENEPIETQPEGAEVVATTGV